MIFAFVGEVGNVIRLLIGVELISVGSGIVRGVRVADVVFIQRGIVPQEFRRIEERERIVSYRRALVELFVA